MFGFYRTNSILYNCLLLFINNPLGPADTLDEQKKMWLIVGICLHAIISPLLKKYIDPIVQNLYNALVANHNINMQCYRGYLRKYPAGNQYFLNYESINNNRNLPKKKISNKWMIDYQKYNYNISSHVDLSKLFLQPSMAQYSAIDHESCDSSALLGMVININTFPTAVQTVAEKVIIVTHMVASQEILLRLYNCQFT